MANDDEAARKARAENLRKRIGELVTSNTESEKVSEGEVATEGHDLVSDKEHADQEAPSGQNLRELIDRRMRELDQKKR